MSEVLHELKSGVLSLTINRPESRNSLNLEVGVSLRALLKEAQTDKNVRLITLTGAGDKVFCAGGDLKGTPGQSGGGHEKKLSEYRQLLLDLHHSTKPTLALARGHVLAGGLGLLLACDLAIVCDDIYFSTPEIGVGMFPMMVLGLLSRHIGVKRCNELALLGEKISANQARDWGIVNAIHPRAQFEKAASELSLKLAAKSGRILALGKGAMARVDRLGLEESLEILERSLSDVMATEDSKEGRRAFAEKREPQWRDC